MSGLFIIFTLKLSMASIYRVGQTKLLVIEFDQLLEKFSGATNLEFLMKEEIIEVRYDLEGERQVLFTRAHILLAACTYARETFFKNPLESKEDWDISHKTSC